MRLEVRALALESSSGERLCAPFHVTVGPGQLWCVLGRNGCGKTTLLRSLAGLRPLSPETVFLGERSLERWGARELARVRAFLPQSQKDAFSSSVLETVLVGRFPHRAGFGRGWFENRAERALAGTVLAELGLEALERRDVQTLSGGERQRVALATVLLQQPRIMFLDEPVSHLDFDVQMLLMRVLTGRLAQIEGVDAIVMSVHDVNLAARFATHVLLFSDDGEVLTGPTSEVLTAAHLGRAFRHAVEIATHNGQNWFIAQ